MSIIQKWNSISLVKRIVCGLIIGAILGLLIPHVKVIGILGTLFVGALKAVAPIRYSSWLSRLWLAVRKAAAEQWAV